MYKLTPPHCADLYLNGPEPLCLSMDRVYYFTFGKSIFPDPEKCGKGKCAFFVNPFNNSLSEPFLEPDIERSYCE